MTDVHIQRFWSRVQRSGPDDCWLWTGGTGSRLRYGRMRVGKLEAYAHRLSYEMHIGAIPEGFVVMHTCDVPQCVNPAHLSVGTHADNIADRDAKGRTARGFRSNRIPDRKLTAEEALFIFANQWVISRRKLARRFGVAYGTIQAIQTGLTYREITDAVKE